MRLLEETKIVKSQMERSHARITKLFEELGAGMGLMRRLMDELEVEQVQSKTFMVKCDQLIKEWGE